MEYQFNTVEEALEELRAGHLILTIDDPDRENEGDLDLRGTVCHDRERQLHGDPCQGPDLHTDE